MAAASEVLVQKQVDAYNAHDLDSFVHFYSPDAAYVRQGDNSVLFQGHDAIREAYGTLFQNHPAVRVNIANRIVLDRFVIDLEHITGRSDIAEMWIVAIYEVSDDLIQKVWVLRS
ncbi:MAG TPA: nuclear transport factor 2 family protein [Roseiflexaceae bacterium]|nr:nuclear transport factor 2 family protein [Roseiflexaceae bacterium]